MSNPSDALSSEMVARARDEFRRMSHQNLKDWYLGHKRDRQRLFARAFDARLSKPRRAKRAR